MIIIYLSIFFINFEYFNKVSISFYNIFIKQIIPSLFVVYIFMFLANLIFEKDFWIKKIKNSKSFVKYLFIVFLWIFSIWPVYLWYPLLKKMQWLWLNYWHIASFTYARAIKIPFFIAMIFYFWFFYSLLFNIALFFFAFLIWIIINLIFVKI